MDDLRCCLADFGLSLFAESQVLDSSSRMKKGSIRWLAPEYMDSALFDQSYMTARDIYAYGCTIIEVRPAAHLPSTPSYDILPRSLPENRLLAISRMKPLLYMRS